MEKIAAGVHRFRNYIFPHLRGMFGSLAEGQQPHALMISCSDSRVVPNLITDTRPGELFIERNPGNISPIYDKTAMGGVSASIEYAVAVLQVPNIIVCGHSDCGAMKGILQVEDAPLVSIDFRGNPHSSIVDSAYTKVMDGDFVKLLAWYDNEWGYSNRCIDLLKKVATSL